MNCLVWNARGLGNSRAFHEFRRLLADHSPTIVFISETKLKSSYCRSWCSYFGYKGMVMVEAQGRSGGLLLMWKEPIDMSIRSHDQGHIDCVVRSDQASWRFTGFYGNPDLHLRPHSWELLRRLHNGSGQIDEAWLVGGDFNEILRQSEKSGGNYRNMGQIESFRQAVEDCGLSDFFQDDASFTWSNKRSDGEEIRARLDRFLMNMKWLELFPNSKMITLDFYGSDHQALLLKIEPGNQICSRKGRKRFHFEQKWLLDKNFIDDFLRHWLNQPSISSLSSKLEHCKHFLNSWAGTRFDRLGKKLHELRSERVKWLQCDPNKTSQLEVRRLSDEIEKLAEMEEVHWKQRSRTNWLGLGDRNSSYFHMHATERKRKNTIMGLFDNSGNWQNEESKIAGIVEAYFSDMFTSSNPSINDIDAVLKHNIPTLPGEAAESLLLPFTAEEVKKALFQMHPTKAPGPDGFPPGFFQKLWPMVGDSVVSEVLQILNGDGSIDCLNNTFIVLVPKVKKPRIMQDFRPISLCNTTYKIVSKVLVNRLRPILEHIVDPMQSAFIKGRLISDNILLGFECMHWLRQQKKGKAAYAIAKLDMSKAYDRVEWSYLHAILNAMNFPAKFVELIMSCVSTAKFSFVVNRKVYGNVTPSRGLRQGDPLSPFLFVLCAQDGIRQIKGIMDLYSKASGQLINFDKSAAVCSPNCNQDKHDWVRNLMRIKVVEQHSFYLGLPTFSAKKRRLQFDFIREKVGRRVESWKNKLFSAGGREVLIKSVLQAIPIYAMSCFRIPVGVCLEIERLCQKFWWGGSDTKRTIHWSKWEDLCVPKSQGGLGFRRLELFNRALLAKQVWRIIQSPNSLVARVLKARYFKNSDIMDAKIACNSSFIWRSLCWGRDLLREGLRWKVRDGASIQIFKDAWIPSFSSGKLILSRDEEGDHRVSDLIRADFSWNKELIRSSFLPVEASAIESIKLDPHAGSDFRYWKFAEDGMYNVKSGYLLALGFYKPKDFCSSSGCYEWWKVLWKLKIPPKVRIFAWRLVRGFIPVDAILKKRHLPVAGNCSWCHRKWGSLTHCLIFCNSVKHVWESTRFWALLRNMQHLPFEEISRSIFDKLGLKQLASWIMLLWAIWGDLCKIKHESQGSVSLEIVDRSETYWSNFVQARLRLRIQNNPFPKIGAKRWVTPPRGRYRLDVDVSYKSHLPTMGIGVILRDHTGETLAAMARGVARADSVLVGELMAILAGINLCVEVNVNQVQVFSDSILAIHVLSNVDETQSLLCKDVVESILSAKHSRVDGFYHMKREANQAAHALANWASSSDSTMFWRSNFPVWLMSIVNNDLLK